MNRNFFKRRNYDLANTKFVNLGDGLAFNFKKKLNSVYDNYPLKDKSTQSQRGNICNKHFKSYLHNAMLHGLSYVGNDKISYGERMFWLMAFMIASIIAIYLISNIYVKHTTNPVLISANPNQIVMEDIPFPAVTICNLNLARKDVSEKIREHEGFDNEKMILNDICSKNDPSLIPPEHSGDRWEFIKEFMLNISQPCGKMLKLCKWSLRDVPCEDYFNVIATNEGLCCTFNLLPLNKILRFPDRSEFNPSFNLFNKYRVIDWDPDNGYFGDTSYNLIPFRSPGPGTILGSSFTIDADVENYYCSNGCSDGVKILLHNPSQLPNMEDHGFLLPVGYEIRTIFKPVIEDTSPSFRALEFNKRNCYFGNERYLHFYRKYSNTNCRMECLANKTIHHCGCVPFYFPSKIKLHKLCLSNKFISEAHDTPICLEARQSCVTNVKESLELTAEDDDPCDCKPVCSQVKYEKVMSYGQIANRFELKGFLQNKNMSYVRNNIIIAHIYYEVTEFTGSTKNEHYGTYDMIASIGGILGFFLGFSLLSVVEIIYHLSLKLVCNGIRAKRQVEAENRILIIKTVAKSKK